MTAKPDDDVGEGQEVEGIQLDGGQIYPVNLTLLMQALTGNGGRVLGPANIARRLWEASEGMDRPENRLRVPLTAAATAVSAIKVPMTFNNRWVLAQMAFADNRIEMVRDCWEISCEKIEYLRGRVDPLLDWIDDATEAESAALGRCFHVIAETNWVESVMHGADGDLLTPLVNWLLHKHDPRWPKEGFGTFDEWLHDALKLARMMSPGDAVCFPYCQVGAPVLALAFCLRHYCDKDPRDMIWYVCDPSPISVALAAMNMAYFDKFGDNVILLSGDDVDEELARRAPRGAKRVVPRKLPPEGLSL